MPIERHRPESVAAIEKRSPKLGEVERPESEKKRVVVTSAGEKTFSAPGKSTVEDEVLVVVSKVRKYIADVSGMNTSASVYDALTERVKRLCDRAIEEAKRQGRKTVMDRDLQ